MSIVLITETLVKKPKKIYTCDFCYRNIDEQHIKRVVIFDGNVISRRFHECCCAHMNTYCIRCDSAGDCPVTYKCMQQCNQSDDDGLDHYEEKQIKESEKMINDFRFIAWMKQKRAWKYFVNCYTDSDTIENYLRDVRPSSYILQAFKWDCTSQGWKYWNRLNDKWLAFVAEE